MQGWDAHFHYANSFRLLLICHAWIGDEGVCWCVGSHAGVCVYLVVTHVSAGNFFTHAAKPWTFPDITWWGVNVRTQTSEAVWLNISQSLTCHLQVQSLCDVQQPQLVFQRIHNWQANVCCFLQAPTATPNWTYIWYCKMGFCWWTMMSRILFSINLITS